MKSIESVGKNVEQAIENGLKELSVSRDKVTIEVIDAGGFFKKAKVVLTLDKDALDTAKERENNIKRLEELERRGELDSDLSSLYGSDASNDDNVNSIDDDVNKDDKMLDTNEEVFEHLEVSTEESKDTMALSTCDNQVESSLSKGAGKVFEFAVDLLKNMNIDAGIEISEKRDIVSVEIVGRDANKIIGKHGEGLNAFQYLCNIVGSKYDRDCPKINVNACGYKEEREQELIKLARKLKYSAIRSEKAIKLEPMSALDRKTIHKALKDDDLVSTHSEGEEPRRYIVIEPKHQENA